MTPPEAQTLLAQLLTGAAGGDPKRWAKLIGKIEETQIMADIRTNWRVVPVGATDEEAAAIEKAANLVREQEPYLTLRK